MSNHTGENTLDGAGESTEGISTSRSGRKIKKNSLLAVYDSPDVIETRGRKPVGLKKVGPNALTSQSHVKTQSKRGRPALSSKLTGVKYAKHFTNKSDLKRYDGDEEELSESGYLNDQNGTARLSGSSQHLGSNGRLTSQAQSTYMLEKSFGKQRKVTGIHPVIGQKVKTVRKDKGSPRVTAYMLWAKEQRSVFSKKYPHLDFSTVSKKLSDLWATVPQNQKRMWKTKAAKQMKKRAQVTDAFKNSPGSSIGHLKKIPGQLVVQQKGRKNTTPQQSLLPKRPPGRPRKYPSPIISQPVTAPGPSIPSPSFSKSFQKAIGLPSLVIANPEEPLSTMNIKHEAYNFKVTGTDTLDVAAHFSLLGESMRKLGAQLQRGEPSSEQAGSDSLSCLLDSLLCSIGPLLCLTQLVPELNCIPESKLKNILNNVGYVMPGP